MCRLSAHTHARCQWRAQRGPQSGILQKHTETRGVHRQMGEINRNASDWHRWSWLTRVTLTVGSSCCPPSLPPSCLTQLMSKLGSAQRGQCGEGENTMLSCLWRSPSSYFLLAILRPRQTGQDCMLEKYISNHFITLHYSALDLHQMKCYQYSGLIRCWT